MTVVIQRYNDNRPAPSDVELVRERSVSGWHTVEEAVITGTQTVLAQPFSLTAQELKDSALTPATILAAQGAGTLIVPTMYVFNFQAGLTPFNGDAIELVYGDQNLNDLFIGLQGSGFVGWTVGAFNAGTAEGGTAVDYLGQPIRLRANLRGPIVTSIVADGGGGYAIGDTGTVDDGSPNASYIVNTVNSGGVLTFTIADPGDDYTLGSGGAATDWTTTPGGAQPGGGAGFQVRVTSVDASGSDGDGTLSGVLYYLVSDLS